MCKPQENFFKTAKVQLHKKRNNSIIHIFPIILPIFTAYKISVFLKYKMLHLNNYIQGNIYYIYHIQQYFPSFFKEIPIFFILRNKAID